MASASSSKEERELFLHLVETLIADVKVCQAALRRRMAAKANRCPESKYHTDDGGKHQVGEGKSDDQEDPCDERVMAETDTGGVVQPNKAEDTGCRMNYKGVTAAVAEAAAAAAAVASERMMGQVEGGVKDASFVLPVGDKAVAEGTTGLGSIAESGASDRLREEVAKKQNKEEGFSIKGAATRNPLLKNVPKSRTVPGRLCHVAVAPRPPPSLLKKGGSRLVHVRPSPKAASARGGGPPPWRTPPGGTAPCSPRPGTAPPATPREVIRVPRAGPAPPPPPPGKAGAGAAGREEGGGGGRRRRGRGAPAGGGWLRGLPFFFGRRSRSAKTFVGDLLPDSSQGDAKHQLDQRRQSSISTKGSLRMLHGNNDNPDRVVKANHRPWPRRLFGSGNKIAYEKRPFGGSGTGDGAAPRRGDSSRSLRSLGSAVARAAAEAARRAPRRRRRRRLSLESLRGGWRGGAGEGGSMGEESIAAQVMRMDRREQDVETMDGSSARERPPLLIRHNSRLWTLWLQLNWFLGLHSIVVVTVCIGFHTHYMNEAVRVGAPVMLDLFFLLNFVSRFLVTYICPKTQQEVTDYKAIARRYLRGGGAALELAAAAPLLSLVAFLGSNGIQENWWLSLPRVAKLVNDVYNDVGFSELLTQIPMGYRAMKLTVVFFFILHLLSCMYWHAVSFSDFSTTLSPESSTVESTLWVRYSHAVHKALAVLSASDMVAENTEEQDFMNISLTVSFLISALLIGSFSNLLTVDGIMEARKKKEQGLRHFMRDQKIAKKLQKAIYFYEGLCWDTGQAQYMKAMFQELSPKMRVALQMQLSKAFVEKTPLVSQLPPDGVFGLLQYLTPRIAMPHELVICQGDPGSSMYFISTGRVEVYFQGQGEGAARHVGAKIKVALGTYLVTLGPGNQMGEISLVRGFARTASCRAAQASELFEMAGEDFHRFCIGFPIFLEMMEYMAHQRLRTTKSMEDAKKLRNKLGLLQSEHPQPTPIRRMFRSGVRRASVSVRESMVQNTHGFASMVSHSESKSFSTSANPKFRAFPFLLKRQSSFFVRDKKRKQRHGYQNRGSLSMSTTGVKNHKRLHLYREALIRADGLSMSRADDPYLLEDLLKPAPLFGCGSVVSLASPRTTIHIGTVHRKRPEGLVGPRRMRASLDGNKTRRRSTAPTAEWGGLPVGSPRTFTTVDASIDSVLHEMQPAGLHGHKDNEVAANLMKLESRCFFFEEDEDVATFSSSPTKDSLLLLQMSSNSRRAHSKNFSSLGVDNQEEELFSQGRNWSSHSPNSNHRCEQPLNLISMGSSNNEAFSLIVEGTDEDDDSCTRKSTSNSQRGGEDHQKQQVGQEQKQLKEQVSPHLIRSQKKGNQSCLMRQMTDETKLTDEEDASSRSRCSSQAPLLTPNQEKEERRLSSPFLTISGEEI